MKHDYAYTFTDVWHTALIAACYSCAAGILFGYVIAKTIG